MSIPLSEICGDGCIYGDYLGCSRPNNDACHRLSMWLSNARLRCEYEDCVHRMHVCGSCYDCDIDGDPNECPGCDYEDDTEVRHE